MEVLGQSWVKTSRRSVKNMVDSQHSVKSLRVNRPLRLDSSPTPDRHHDRPPGRTAADVAAEGTGAAAVENLRGSSADGTDNKAAIVPDQRRINRIPFSPVLSEWPPVFFSACSARVGNNIWVYGCSNLLLGAGGRRDGRDVPVSRRRTWTGRLVWAIGENSSH